MMDNDSNRRQSVSGKERTERRNERLALMYRTGRIVSNQGKSAKKPLIMLH